MSAYEKKGKEGPGRGIKYSGRFENGAFRLGTLNLEATKSKKEEEYSGSFAGGDAWNSWVYSGLGVAKYKLEANKFESYAGSPTYTVTHPLQSLTPHLTLITYFLTHSLSYVFKHL